MKEFGPQWHKLTSDTEVLDWVQNCHIEFIDDIEPVQLGGHKVSKFNQSELSIIDREIEKLLSKGVIERCSHSDGEFISPIFLRLKKNKVDYRMILNLKDLNNFVVYKHFKMESLNSVLDLMTPGCFMASIDIKDAYYSVPIAKEHQKFLRFIWRDHLYQYVCLPNGLSSAPRIFTKLLKPVFKFLREQGLLSSAYIDDVYLQGDTYHENALRTVQLLKNLGFVIQEEKSCLNPSQQLEYLGFVLDSVTMTVKLTHARVEKVVKACEKLLNDSHPTILNLAEVIGLMVSSFPGVEYGPLYYRSLDMAKTDGLRQNKGNFSDQILLNDASSEDLRWWITNLPLSSKAISHGEADIIIQTDASSQGWGGVHGEKRAGGRWTPTEASNHINYLELLAIFLSLKALCSAYTGSHIQVQCDNTTAVCYINNMGGSKSTLCNAITKQIWALCITQNNWLSATHLPGCENVEADAESRIFNDRTEWMLDPQVFKGITQKFGNPEIDLFASRLNKQCAKYASWRPDPEASFVDAFSVQWNNLFFYAFPPFSLIGRCLEKIHANKAEGILIVPFWPSQSWYPKLLRLLVEPPIVIHPKRNLLVLPGTRQLHPLREKLTLLACLLSGNFMKNEDFLRKQPTLSCCHGGTPLENNMTSTSANGFYSAVQGKLIQFMQI